MRTTRLTLLIGGLLLAAVMTAHAAEGGFVATLSSDKQAAAGLTTLSAAERTALDRLVAGELATGRNAERPDLAGTFVSRRTEAERKSAGLDRLTSTQLKKLNEFVASALAPHPKPKERPRLKESDVLSAARKAQVHGSVTVAYGWGRGGRDMWAQSLWLEYYDPEDRFSLGIGLSNSEGNGFYGYYPDYFGYYPGYYGFYPDYFGGYGTRYYKSTPVYFEAAARGIPRGDFSFGEGQSFRGRPGGLRQGPAGPRGH